MNAASTMSDRADRVPLPQMEDHECYLTALEPFDPLDLEKECERLEETDAACQSQWDAESALYETRMKLQGREVPRRNYPTASGKVADPMLYPYHTACYPLLDAYNHLYDDEEAPVVQPKEKDAVLPSLVSMDARHEHMLREEDYKLDTLPCSYASIVESLVQTGVSWPVPEEVAHLERLVQETQVRHNSMFLPDRVGDSIQDSNMEGYKALAMLLEEVEPSVAGQSCGPQHLPSDRGERSAVLLKLLKHSMSELQRDHVLASVVLLRLELGFDLNDTDVLRRLLVILRSEYVHCEFPCTSFEPTDHYCNAWYCLSKRLPQVLAFGMTRMTHAHAESLAAFCRETFLREFGHLHINTHETDSVQERRKLLLKRTVVALRNAEDGMDFNDDKRVPVDLVITVVVALGMRAAVERRRLVVARETTDTNNKRRLLDSYFNCIRTLVEIGEACVVILPESERFYLLAAMIVKSLCRALVDTGGDFLQDKLIEELQLSSHETDYLGLKEQALKELRLVMPFRFADRIHKATPEFRSLPGHGVPPPNGSSGISEVDRAIDVALFGRFHDDIRDVVRALFVRNLVDVRAAGLGYGDFLLFCRFDISPLDPALFWRFCSYPIEDAESDEEEEEDEEDEELDEQDIEWDVDEEDHLLSKDELQARNDFTLLALLRAWNAPWTPDSHMSFQPAFRDAVQTLALCTRRHGMPTEIVFRISEFLPRDWWPDERKQCFQYDCQLERVTKAMEEKISARQDGAALTTLKPTSSWERCAGCQVPCYCSKAHRERDGKDGHRRICGKPPFCFLGKEEEQLFAQVLGNETGDLQQNADLDVESEDVQEGEDGNDDDDDGSWESIDSNEGEADDDEAVGKSSITQAIHAFFKKNAYNKTDIERY